jgi:fido (protein-threonine AMPylation protein)
MTDLHERSLFDWPAVKKLGVYHDVDQSAYIARTAQGMTMVKMALSASKEPILGDAALKSLHFMAFGTVHPWAGEYRRLGQEVTSTGLDFSPSKYVAKEMAGLRVEMLKNPLKGSKQYVAEVLGFYHATALMIHPFADGNGRLFREVLDHQAKVLLGHTVTHNLSRAEYSQAITAAQLYGQLKPLANIIERGSHNHWLGVHPETLKLPMNEASRSYALQTAQQEQEQSLGRRRK